MLITPDFSEAQESNNDPVPAGTYKTRILEAELKDTKAGAKRLSWKLQIFGAEGDLAKTNNRIVFHSTMLSGPGAGMLKDFYKAATKSECQGPFDATELYGKEVQVTLATRHNQDGTVSNWPDVKAVRPVH